MVHFAILRAEPWHAVAEVRAVELRVGIDLARQEAFTKLTRLEENDPRLLRKQPGNDVRALEDASSKIKLEGGGSSKNFAFHLRRCCGFQRLLEEARRELARHYLLHSSRELNETAYLLGYEDANSFFRAFHHWEGTSPGQWRVLQRKSQPTTHTQVGAA